MADDLQKFVREQVAKGQAVIDYDPLKLLKELAACIGYCDGYVIRISDATRIRIHETIAFNEGDELYGNRPASKEGV